MIIDSELNHKRLEDIRQFVREIAIPAEAKVVRDNEIPAEIVQIMRERGYFGWSIPREYGGAGMTTEELALANMELSKAATAFRARAGTNTGIGAESIIQDGTPEQKREWLPKLASGEVTGCLALTEPDAGSDATALKATALPVAAAGSQQWRINGTKRYITNAPIAELFTVFARTDPEDLSHRGISAFLIPRQTPGLSTGPDIGIFVV